MPYHKIGPDTIDIPSIAVALSRHPRYCGLLDTDAEWQVAQHSYFVAALRWKRWLGGVGEMPTAEACLLDLLHDGHEAYLCDLPSPVKRLLPEYEALCRVVQRAIDSRAEVRRPEEDPSGKELDDLACYMEWLEFVPEGWVEYSGRLPSTVPQWAANWPSLLSSISEVSHRDGGGYLFLSAYHHLKSGGDPALLLRPLELVKQDPGMGALIAFARGLS